MSYYLEHREQYREKYRKYSKQYRLEHPGYLGGNKEYIKQWNLIHLERARELWRKHSAKRERNLGFEPLNEHFIDSEFHHIDKNKGLYIPKELHKSIWHNQYTGQGMEEINTLAVQWWITQ